MNSEYLLTEINIYPLKSAAGITLDRCELDRRGLRYDRRWMLVDSDGRFLTQRQCPRMALIHTALSANELILSWADASPLAVPLNGAGETRKVRVWNDDCEAIRCGKTAANWFSHLLQTDCELVQIADTEQRRVDPQYAQPHDEVGFADGFPLLLIGQGSLDELNSRLSSPVEMRRFRPNLVVSGAPAHAEDHWSGISLGDTHFRVVKPCSRCVIPSVDPDTGVRGSEPLKTLASYRRWDNKIWFGQNLIADGAGEVRLGQKVVVTEK
ncbi:MAG: MOSC domain-containing protein [gamma proteobacterium symbiont of Bathyaustriella thionipta]|nr:MOSC domain-containing protein [gamma proteobacterium symbiont of Bathyaustriella thionipta]